MLIIYLSVLICCLIRFREDWLNVWMALNSMPKRVQISSDVHINPLKWIKQTNTDRYKVSNYLKFYLYKYQFQYFNSIKKVVVYKYCYSKRRQGL